MMQFQIVEWGDEMPENEENSREIVHAVIDEKNFTKEEYIWRIQNEIKLNGQIQRFFTDRKDFSFPVYIHVNYLGRPIIPPYEPYFPIEDTRFFTLVDFLKYYDYRVKYPYIYPAKEARRRRVGV